MDMPGRNSGTDYNFSFNGKLDDTKDGWQTQDFGARNYDSRLGRFFTEDPKGGKHPNYSPYLYGANRPIDAIDYEGEGPRYPAIAAVFEQRLKQLKALGYNYSFAKYDQQDAKNKIVFSVNLTMNGHTVNQLFEFNEESDDAQYEKMLREWGVDFYDAACAASNSLADRAYWRMSQHDYHLAKPENGIPFMFKVAGTVLTMGAAAEALSIEGGATLLTKTLITVDGVFIADDMTALFRGPNRTFLEYLAEKVGIDPGLIEKAKTANDLVQGLNDLSQIVQSVKKAVEVAANSGKIATRETISSIELLDFIQGQIDMQKHYWELMQKRMDDIDKKSSGKITNESEKTPMYKKSSRYLD